MVREHKKAPVVKPGTLLCRHCCFDRLGDRVGVLGVEPGLLGGLLGVNPGLHQRPKAHNPSIKRRLYHLCRTVCLVAADQLKHYERVTNI
jgi:hypothetical protein